jgi:hypothetical protein
MQLNNMDDLFLFYFLFYFIYLYVCAAGDAAVLPVPAAGRPQADQAGPLPLRLHLRVQPAPPLPQGRPHRPLGPLREGGDGAAGGFVGRSAAPHATASQLQAGAGAGLARPRCTAPALLLNDPVTSP